MAHTPATTHRFLQANIFLTWYPIEKIESGSIELDVAGIDLYNTLESLKNRKREMPKNKGWIAYSIE